MSTKRRSKRVKAEPKIGYAEAFRFGEEVLDDELRKKRVLSRSHGALCGSHAAAAAVHASGQGLAVARGLNPKHAVTQVDRLLSNAGVRMDQVFNR
jgi:hypothetical protein